MLSFHFIRDALAPARRYGWRFARPLLVSRVWSRIKWKRLAEVYFNGLFARFVRNDDLFWHCCLLFMFFVCFYQFRVATRSLALRARGLITNSSGPATIGFLVFIISSDSSPWLSASLK